MAKKYDPNTERLGSQAAALQRIAKNYPDEYKKVCSMRNVHANLYKLPADKFDEICTEALRGLVREGLCKRPQQIIYNQH